MLDQPAQTGAPSTGRVPTIDIPEDTAARLRDLSHTGKPLMVGGMQLFGLDPISATLGPAWPQRREQVRSLARGVIDRRVRTDDICLEGGDLSFIVIYGDDDREAARSTTNAISSEIRTEITKQDPVIGAALTVKSEICVASVDQILARQSGWFRSGAELAPDLGHDRPLPVSEQADGAPLQLCLFLRPVWDIRREAAILYSVEPYVWVERNQWLAGRSAGATREAEEDSAATDLRVLERALAELEATTEDGKRVLIGASICAQSFTVPWRRRLMAPVLRRIEAGFRDRMVIEIVEVDNGVFSAHLHDLPRQLRAVSRYVSLRVPLCQHALKRAARLGFAAVGCDLADEASASEAVVTSRLERFIGAARQAEVPAFVSGVRSKRLAAFAVNAGAAWISGDAVLAKTRKVRGAMRLGREDLFPDLAVPCRQPDVAPPVYAGPITDRRRP